ncbi:MAG: inorganic phosphate transporter [Clostridia bacterium]
MVAVSTTIILIFVILIGLIFTLTNGLHDASSVVATFIKSGAATPKQAIAVGAIFGLLGAVFGGNAVADTISKLIDLPSESSLLLILLSAIIGATLWNLITWKLGLPSSSTHALVGGVIGAVVVSSGYNHIVWGWSELIGVNHQITGIVKVFIALIIAPLLGFTLAFILEKFTKILFRNANFSLNKWLNKMQWIMAAALSFVQRSNDTQKVLGIFTLALIAGKNIEMQTAPLWVKLAAGLVMSIGAMLGGWSTMKTVSKKIFHIKPVHSLNAQMSAVGSLFASTMLGAPVSTTHVVVGSIMGVGAADEYKMVNWGIVREILISWFITIPLSAVVSATIFSILNFILRVA